MNFIRLDEKEDVWVGTGGQDRQSKCVVIRTRSVASDDPWDQISDARVILAGHVVPGLRRILTAHGRPEINNRTNDAFSPRTYGKLRKYLGLS